MKKNKKLFLIFILIISLISLASCDNLSLSITGDSEANNNQKTATSVTTTISKSNEKRMLSIIEMNDVHGYIMQNEDNKMGLSNMSYIINNIRDEEGEDNVLSIACGDMFQGTGLVKMSYGEVMIDALNEMKLDACILGNHEFDWDLPVVLNYFDGDSSNGEANFPLINSNVYQGTKLVSVDGGKIYESYMFDKCGLNIGVIGFIGDVKSSINALYADKYKFDTNFISTTTKIGSNLKENGADIIIVAIHDGVMQDIESYDLNKDLASIKYNDKYLVDAVINAHTHQEQMGKISRDGGVDMPVIQSTGYKNNQLYEFGRIDLKIDENNNVLSCATSHILASSAKDNYDSNVEEVIDKYYEKDEDTLSKIYTKSLVNISRYSANTYNWVANVMLASTGADIAICNTGGLRTNISKGDITFEDVYQFNPFDNHVIVHECSVEKINKFIDSSYYFYNTKDNTLKTSGTYKVAIIDYVYYGNYYKNCYSNIYYDTNLILRDLLLEDLELRDTFNINTDTEAKITLKWS